MKILKNFKRSELMMLFLSIVLVAFLFLRSGRFPAASKGDEVWWTESGYWLLLKGVLCWGVFDDPFGSSIKSFWPPVAALIQALNIKVFGLTAFSMHVQAAEVATVTGIVLFRLSRELSLARVKSFAVVIAVLGFTAVDLRIGQARMENLSMLFFVSSQCLLIMAGKSMHNENGCSKFHVFLMVASAGLFLGLACISYYPQAPFCLLGGLITLALLKTHRILTTPLMVGFLCGGAVIAFSALVWIYPDFRMFWRQITLGGEGSGNTYPLTRIGIFTLNGGAVNLLISLELCAVTAIIILAARLSSCRMERALFAGFVPTCFVWVVYSTPAMAMCAYSIAPLALVVLIGRLRGKWIKKTGFVALFGLIFVGLLRQSLVGWTLYKQWNARDYAQINSSIHRLNLGKGKIAVSQSGWLALRQESSFEILHLMPTRGQGVSFHNRSMALRDSERIREFSAFIIDKSLLPELRRDYPGFDAEITSGRLIPSGAISMPFSPTLRSPAAPYDLVIFLRNVSSLRKKSESFLSTQADAIRWRAQG